MTAQEFVAQALRQQGNAGQLLETAWQLYAVHVKVPPGGVQWTESRRCFFAGALLTFEAIIASELGPARSVEVMSRATVEPGILSFRHRRMSARTAAPWRLVRAT